MHGHEFLLNGDAWNGSRLRALFGYSTGPHRRNMVGADEKARVFAG